MDRIMNLTRTVIRIQAKGEPDFTLIVVYRSLNQCGVYFLYLPFFELF